MKDFDKDKKKWSCNILLRLIHLAQYNQERRVYDIFKLVNITCDIQRY